MHIFTFTKKTIISWIFFIILILTTISIIALSSKHLNTKSVSSDIENSDNSNDNNNNFNNLQQTLNNLSNNKEKIAYLTFDDGPTLMATGKVLDILKKENIKASFFVIGKYVEKHPELVKRAYDEGHYISNHSYNHNNKRLYSSIDSFINEIKLTDQAISNAIGVPGYTSKIFRFPNGYMSPQNKYKKKKSAAALNELGYSYIDWNCLNKDSEKKISNKKLLENLKNSSKNKGTLIILMHDTCDVNNTPDVLEDSIKYLKNEGYEFRNFYDLMSKSQL